MARLSTRRSPQRLANPASMDIHRETWYDCQNETELPAFSQPVTALRALPESTKEDGIHMEENHGLAKASLGKVQLRSFVTAFVILAAFMVAAFILCAVLPGGQYARSIVDGKETIIADSFAPVQGGIPLWKALLSPLLVLGDPGGSLLALIVVFLLVVAGSFVNLENAGVLNHMLVVVAAKFRRNRWLLLALVTLLMMSMGALIGSFEECIPMIPIAISLSIAMGWDVLVGLGMSLLAVGFGFSSGVMNPFTVGVAQNLAGLPMFSGLWLRAVSFVIIYATVLVFLITYAKKLERQNPPSLSPSTMEKNAKDPRMDRALGAFAIIIGCGLVCLITFGLIPALSDLVLPLTAIMFFAASFVSVRISGASPRQYGKWFLQGMKTLAPAVVLLLMASSIRYILVQGAVMDTILHGAVSFIADKPKDWTILFIYLLVLLLELAISSGSAKAFLLIPLIMPMIDIVGMSRQLAVLAFAFGDGFSNVFYPTNVALLIGLSIAHVSYGKWFRFTWKIQLVNLAVTSLILLFGLRIGY